MPATGQIYQVTYVMSDNGQAVENVLHYRELTGASTPAQITTSANKFFQFIAPCCANSVLFTQLIIKQMTPIAFDETISVPTTTTGSSGSSSAGNTTVAAVLTKRTGTAGKTHRGRIYVGGLDSSATAISILTSGLSTALGTFVSNFMGAFGPTGTDTHLQIGVYSRVIGGTSPFTVAGWQPLTSLDIQTVLGNQRRRRLGVGI